MARRKDARKPKDLKGKKLGVAQQAVVRGGISDGTSNTLMIAEKVVAINVRPTNRGVSP